MEKLILLTALLGITVGCKKDEQLNIGQVNNIGSSVIVVTTDRINTEVGANGFKKVPLYTTYLNVECKLLNCKFEYNGTVYNKSTVIFGNEK